MSTSWVQVAAAIATSMVTIAFTYGMLRATVSQIKSDVDGLIAVVRQHREDFFLLREEVRVNQARASAAHTNGRDE